MIAAAAGTKRAVRGDCVLARIAAQGGLSLGGECAPQFISERSWLEAAQAASKGAARGGEQLAAALLTQLARPLALAKSLVTGVELCR